MNSTKLGSDESIKRLAEIDEIEGKVTFSGYTLSPSSCSNTQEINAET
jgi:hypothetical protein